MDKQGPCLDEAVFAELARDRMREILARVPARARHAFLLHRLARRTIAQIARQLGVPRSVVERDLAMVVERLTQALFKDELVQ